MAEGRYFRFCTQVDRIMFQPADDKLPQNGVQP